MSRLLKQLIAFIAYMRPERIAARIGHHAKHRLLGRVALRIAFKYQRIRRLKRILDMAANGVHRLAPNMDAAQQRQLVFPTRHAVQDARAALCRRAAA